MDAPHCQTAHLTYLPGRGAHLLVCVKGNHPNLLKRLKALPWKQVPLGHTSTDRAHGRIEEGTLNAVTVTGQAGGLGLPQAAQAIASTDGRLSSAWSIGTATTPTKTPITKVIPRADRHPR